MAMVKHRDISLQSRCVGNGTAGRNIGGTADVLILKVELTVKFVARSDVRYRPGPK